MKFNIILADPPWNFETWSEKGRDRSPDYPIMTIPDLKKLPVDQIASENSTLFLWGTNPMLPWVLDVMRSWGFEYATKAFCWVKLNKISNKPFMGLGYWTRANPEDCWLGTRGHPVRVSKAVRQLIIRRVGNHSSKPLVVKDRIVDLMGDLPRIELFARERSMGWTALGYDIDGRDIRESIYDYIC